MLRRVLTRHVLRIFKTTTPASDPAFTLVTPESLVAPWLRFTISLRTPWIGHLCDCARPVAEHGVTIAVLRLARDATVGRDNELPLL